MHRRISRRTALSGLGALVTTPFLPGCPSPTGLVLGDAGLPTDAPPLADAPPIPDAGFRWASGGTVSMTGVASYPDPFAAPPDPACVRTLPTTLGPCFYDSPDRQDVSEGYAGLPMRLTFRILDGSCAPIEGARLDIWHTGNTGLYSGGPIDFCTGADADAIAHRYFRGTRTSDARGVVAFDTCFPGAYAGRALHIHFQVFLPGGGAASLVSQLFFPQPLIDEIFAGHPDYVPYGPPDTPNAADSIYLGVGTSGIVEHQRMDDGAMLAWLDVVIV